MFVPDLFFAEFANIFWKAERLGRCDPATTDLAVSEIVGRGFPTFATAPLLAHAGSIARTFQRTIYDNLYLAVAIAIGAPLLTADRRLVHSVQGRLPALWLGAMPQLF